MRYLVLVESPAKVKKISDILNGQNDGNKYVVAATIGHILALNSEKTLGVDLADKYKPDYVPHPQKLDVIANLRRLASGCDQVLIASDLDQEGEFIGYSICHLLKLSLTETPRIIFKEITKTAILEAVKNRGILDFNLLDAQKCRRVADRLIGFLITRAAKSVNPKLTVGRVQTIMVKLIIDREKEMENFQKTLSYHTNGIFDSPNQEDKQQLETKLNRTFESNEEVHKFLTICSAKGTTFPVESINDRMVSKNPPPPLITSTLQSLISRSLSISPKEVMDTAQKLYQQGLISYPRTDCPKLPDEKMDECKKYVLDNYGEKYYHRRGFKSKDASAQEAHACIYPTKIEMPELVDSDEFPYSLRMKRVYRFVWLYTVSSQMSPSETKVTKCTVGVEPEDSTSPKEKFVAENHNLTFEGFLAVWGKTAIASEEDDDNEGDDGEQISKNQVILNLKEGDLVDPYEIQSKQKATQGPAPYTESSLITQMKKYGVGRPSTYGGILSMIMDDTKKGFVYKASKPGEKMKIEVLTWKPTANNSNISKADLTITQNAYRNRLYSTELGRAIDNFVNEYFSNVFNYGFTRDLETKMNRIESGDIEWYKVIDELYKAFSPKLKQFPTWTTRENVDSNPARKPKREIGQHQGTNVYTYLGKYGPVLQIGDDDQPHEYISLPKEYNIESVTLDQIEHLFGFPYHLGKLKSGDERTVTLKKSKYGLYLDCRDGKIKGKTYQVNESMFDPEQFDPDQPHEKQISALKLELIQTSIEQTDAPKECLRQVQDIKIISGKFGPYFIFNGVLVGIPKFHNIDLITYEECLNLYQVKSKKSGKYKKPKADAPKKKIKIKFNKK